MKLLPEKPGKISPKILSEQTRFSYEVFPVTGSMLALAIVLVGFLIWDEISPKSAFIWGAAILTALLARFVAYFGYKRVTRNQEIDPRFWRQFFVWGAFTTAGLMGFAGLVYFPELSDSSKMVFTLLILGLVSGALPILASDLRAYSIYILLSLAPIAYHALAAEIIAVKLIGSLVFVFIGMLMLSCHLFNRALLDSLIYRYRSELLADRLQIANNRLSAANQELQRISTVDELTGTYNRRFFNHRFDEVWADHMRESSTLSALMIDVDLFKSYNDSFGHLQGDHCLRRIAEEIIGVIRRPRDFVARFGGEEFVMVLPNTDIAGAKEIAARIHKRVELLAMPHRRNDAVNRVTVSIGGASIKPGKDSDSDQFLQRVDHALYMAKNRGRNTSVFV
ncbi:MAG TPA: diguanylate cyclase, partial [Gammaproteobacteria bacterium]